MFTLELTEREIELVLTGLGRLPYLEVYQLISKVAKSAKEQNDAAKLTNNGTSHGAEVKFESTLTKK